jgi:hypothetical protein
MTTDVTTDETAAERKRHEVVRVVDALFVDALFLDIAEGEQDHEQDEFVETLWRAFAAGELRLINDCIEPVNSPNERRIVARENQPIVDVRQAVLGT